MMDDFDFSSSFWAEGILYALVKWPGTKVLMAFHASRGEMVKPPHWACWFVGYSLWAIALGVTWLVIR